MKLVSTLTYPVTGYAFDKDENTGLEINPLAGDQKRASFARRGLHPVLLWLAAILAVLVLQGNLSDGSGDGSGQKAALQLLTGVSDIDVTLKPNATDPDSFEIKDLPKGLGSWYSVAGYNWLQLILLVSSGLVLGLKSISEDFSGWFNAIIELILWALRLLLEAMFFGVSALAVLYSALAYEKLALLQPSEFNSLHKDYSNYNERRDNWEANVSVLTIFILNVLTFLSFVNRDGGKGSISAKNLEARLKAEIKGLAEEENEKNGAVELVARNIGGAGGFKSKMPIHNYY